MKIIIYGHYFFSHDMQWGFRQLGYDTEIITEAQESCFRETLRDAGADLLVTLGGPWEFVYDNIVWLGRSRPAGLKHIHWDTDGISSLRYPSLSGEGIEMDIIYAAKPDLVLTMCPEMQDFVREKGFACAAMPYAYSPAVHFPMPEYYDEEHHYINLIGRSYREFYANDPDHYRYRSLRILVKPLVENGYTVNVYGDQDYIPLMRDGLGIPIPPESYRGLMPYESTGAAYNSSFINLVTQNHQDTLTKRTFEILGSGGFALSADNRAVRKLFVPGRDLAVSASPEQTLALVKYYENHMDEWRKIRKNALSSAQNHTYRERAQYIMKLFEKL